MKEFKEFHSEDAGIFFKVDKILFNKKSKFQKIFLFENKTFGKILTLDGLLMLAEKDEFFYHESLVHPALSLLSKPDKILVIGGGDGKTVYEIFKHKPEEVHLVEIDREVIKVSEKFFKWENSFKKKNLKIFIQDGVEFVRKTDYRYDVIIVDSSDPVGPAKKLYKREFYLNLKRVLKKQGILVIQAESPVYHRKIQRKMYKEFSKIFKICRFYISPVPTYPGGIWAYLFCSDYYNPLRKKIKKIPPGLKFYSHKVHRAIFEIADFLK